MAEPYYILYDNMTWRDYSGVVVTTNVSDANSPAGFRVAKAFDGSKLTQWKVTTSHGTDVIATIDRGAAQSAETDYGQGLGLFNHNLDSAGCNLIEVQSATAPGGPWTDVFEVDPSPDSNLDFIYQSDQLRGTERYFRIVINFSGGGGPAVDLLIGQLYLGKVVGLDTDEEPGVPLDSPYTFGAGIDRSPGGGRVHRGRAFREQALALSFRSRDSGALTKLKRILNRQQGAVYPIGIHTHRHTGAGAWGDRVNLNITGAGGAYFAQIDSETIELAEPFEGVYDFGLPLVRHMTESET